jgi:hypothetical protein
MGIQTQLLHSSPIRIFFLPKQGKFTIQIKRSFNLNSKLTINLKMKFFKQKMPKNAKKSPCKSGANLHKNTPKKPDFYELWVSQSFIG